MNFTDYYYSEVCGYYPEDEYYDKTNKVMNYLKDANIDNKTIINFILSCSKNDFITFNMLPESLWEDSLLEKNKFYYHRLLHIKSKPPKWNAETNKSESSKFYLEMIIKFTIEDVIDYFYRTLNVDKILSNKKADKGAVEFLLDKYKKFAFIEPIDFVLSLIDYAKDNMNENKINSILQLTQNEAEVYELLKKKTTDANFKNMNRIVWR